MPGLRTGAAGCARSAGEGLAAQGALDLGELHKDPLGVGYRSQRQAACGAEQGLLEEDLGDCRVAPFTDGLGDRSHQVGDAVVGFEVGGDHPQDEAPSIPHEARDRLAMGEQGAQ